MNIQRIVALLKKEFTQLSRDKKLLPIILLAPVVQLALMGYAVSVEIKATRTNPPRAARSSRSS